MVRVMHITGDGHVITTEYPSATDVCKGSIDGTLEVVQGIDDDTPSSPVALYWRDVIIRVEFQ